MKQVNHTQLIQQTQFIYPCKLRPGLHIKRRRMFSRHRSNFNRDDGNGTASRNDRKITSYQEISRLYLWGTNIVILKRAEMISVQQKNKQNRPCRFVKNQICKVFFSFKNNQKNNRKKIRLPFCVFLHIIYSIRTKWRRLICVKQEYWSSRKRLRTRF